MGKLFTKTPKLNRNQLYFFLILTLNLSFFFPASAGTPPIIKWTAKNAFEQKVFIENKGQFEIPEKNIDSKSILFSGRQDGLQYYFAKDGIWIVRNVTVKLTHRDREQQEQEKKALILQSGAKAAKDDDDDDDDEKSFKVVKEFHEISFVGANADDEITSDDEVSQIYNFSTNGSTPVKAHAFKKITYRNLYPGIDMEFYFPEDKQGFKYVFIVHPGADISAIKIQYPLDKSVTLSDAGNIILESEFGEFTDHAPVASQATGNSLINCSFTLTKKTVQFTIGDYDKKQTLIIDPWTITPVFRDNNDAYDVDYDDAGNCYVYGGVAPYQILKFNSVGTLLWSYTETFTSGYPYYGGFAVDRNSQSVYVVDGFNPYTGTQIIKLNSSGAQVTVFQGNANLTEMWRIAFSRCANEPVITGGGITVPSFEASYLDTSLTTLSPVNILGTNAPHHDIWGLAFDDFGSCYMATMETEPGITDTTFNNRLLKLPMPSLLPTTWAVKDGYKFREISSTKYTSYIANGFNGMAVSNTHLYTYDSYELKKWSTANGALMNTLNINGNSQVAMDWAGLTSDDCDNIFVGSKENILQYNSDLALVNTTAMPDTVHDVILSKKKVLYACGINFVYAIQETLPACFTATNDIANPSCGDTSGAVIITPMGGNAPYTVTWSTASHQTSDTLTNLSPGTYIATIADNSCPSDTIYDTVTIVNTSTFTITVNSPSICKGDSATLTALGSSATYTWTPATGLSATTGSSVTANPTVTTTYTVIGIAAGGCVDTVQSVVMVNPIPVIAVAVPAPICNGSSTTLTASGGTSYTWSPATSLSASTGSSVIANPTTSTTYTITGTNGSGCTATTTVVVTVSPSLIIAVATPLPICDGSSTTLTASGGTSYTWTPATGLSATSGSSVTANPTTTTTYTITGTNGSGCTATTTVVVTVNPSLTIAVATPLPICDGSSTILTVSGGTSYTWSPATGLSATTGSSVTANPTTTTTYTITGTNGSGCTATTTVVVTVNPSLTIAVATPTPICDGSSTTLSASGAASYTWTPATGLSATTGSSVTANPTTTTTYTITGTNGSGCTATTTVVVTVNPSLTITVATPAPICDASSTTLIVSGAATYTWTPATGLSATTGSSVTSDPTTTTTYIITGTNGSGCSATTTVVVTVNPSLTISVATPTPICDGSSTTLSASGAASYTWTPATGLSATTGSSVTANPTTTTTYTITGTNGSGCTATTTVVVTVNPSLTITVATPAPICIGSSTILAAIGGTSYTWSPATGLSATTGSSVIANPTTTTTYIIAGTNVSGCTATDSVVVVVNQNPTIAVATPAPICIGSNTTLSASGAGTYTWSPATGLSATTGSSVTANPTTTITYAITGTNGSGCTATTTVVVTVNPSLTIAVGTPAPICDGSSTTLSASGAATYTWTPATGLSATTGSSVTSDPTTTTTYTITGTSGSGCTATTIVVVTVNPNPTITIATPTSICDGSSTTLSASGTATYTWSPAIGLSATTGSSVTANPTTTTTYTIMGTSASGCTSTDSVIVVVNPNPTITVVTPAPICNGNTTILAANGAALYAWTPATGLSATTGSSVTANPTVTTIYTITGTNASGCSATTTAEVAVNPNPIVVVATPAPICNGSSTALSANGATTYTWSPATGLSETTGSSITANPITTTTYTIIGTNTSGCSATTKVAVTVNPSPTIAIVTPAPICNGSSTTLSASGAATYTWSPATGLSATTGSSVAANPIATTTYTITGTNGSGCMTIDTITVTVSPNPTITVATPAPICNGSSATLSANGATLYTWTPAIGLSATSGSSVTANPTTTTTYTITGTNASGCSATTTVEVAVNPNPTIVIITPAPICNGSSTTLAASGGVSYTWTPATGLSATTGSLVTANPTITTTYIITGTNGSGCLATQAVTVKVNPNPTISVATPAQICTGGSTILTVNGSTSYISYIWSPVIGLSPTAGSSVVADPITTTTYTIVGTDTNGCSATTTAAVIVNPNPVVSVTNPAPICNGNSTILTASGATIYAWSPSTALSATNDSTVTANPTTTTTYTITGTNGSGCSSTTQVTVTVNPIPTISATNPPAICNGNSTTVSASGAISYVWTPSTGLSATSGSSVSANPPTTTNYTITGTNANGCTATTMVAVTVNPNPTITVTTPAPICDGSSTALTASYGGANYTWSPSTGLSTTTGTSVTANPITTTTYTVTESNVTGCSATTQVTVTVNPNPVITVATPAPICNGNNTTLAANGASSYTWSPSIGLSTTTGSSVTAYPITTSTYTITGTNANGCSATTTVAVSVNPDPIISVTNPPAMCNGGSTALIANGAISYIWTPSIGLSSTSGSSVIANPTTTTTYTITGTNANGCIGSTVTSVMVNPNPTINITIPPAYCVGDSAVLTVQGANSYVWSPSMGLSATNGSSVIAKPTVTSEYTVTGVDINGCSGTGRVTVIVNPNPVIVVNGPPAVCNGKQANLKADGASYYSWVPGIGLNSSTGSSVVATPTETSTYTVIGTDDNGCSGKATVAVLVRPLPAVSVPGLNPSFCINSSPVTLIGNPSGGTFSGDGVNGNQFNPAAVGDGSYQINYVYTDLNGCVGSTTTDITVNPLPKVVVSPNNPTVCSGIPVNLIVSGASTYTWAPPTGLSDSTGNSVNANPTLTTTYIITGTNADGCSDTAMVTVNVDSMPQAMFNAQPPSYCDPLNMQFNNVSTGGNTYSWDFGDGSTSDEADPQHTYTQGGTYEVRLTVTSPHGCTNDIVKEEIIQETGNNEVKIANAFTPTIPGDNSVVAAKVLCTDMSNFVFRIYNRWGQLLFQTYDPDQGWDGTFNGQMQEVGVFDYYIEFQCGDCKVFKKGNITLLK